MSQSRKLQYIDINKLKSNREVLAELELLNTRLLHSELSHFTAFNKAYFVVTKKIINAAEDGYFAEPERMEKISVYFAKYYFQAINDSLLNTSNMATAWTKLNESAGRKNMPVFIQLLMGANAHINHDLPLALYEAIGTDDDSQLLKDMLKVDKLLMKSGREILTTFEENSRLLCFIKLRCKYIYFWPIMRIILYWRIIAWRNYNYMKNTGSQSHSFRRRSAAISTRLLRLASWLR